MPELRKATFRMNLLVRLRELFVESQDAGFDSDSFALVFAAPRCFLSGAKGVDIFGKELAPTQEQLEGAYLHPSVILHVSVVVQHLRRSVWVEKGEIHIEQG
jgi:hypothetical protein